MNRLPYPRNVAPEVQLLLDARPPRNIFKMMAHAPALMPGLMELTGAILYRAKLDPISRELAVLRVGHLCGSHYEVGQHRKIAKAVGLSEEKIDAVVADVVKEEFFSQREKLVLRMAEEVVRNIKAPDALFAETVAAFGAEQTMELLIVIGTYVMLAQVLENAEVQLEEGGGPAPEDVQKIFGNQAGKK